MPRPLSWLDRIPHLARAVAASARSHFDRKDLQHLFQLQPRSAQNLMNAMPVVTVGNGHLVEREALLSFLTQLSETQDPARAFATLRTAPARPARRKLRILTLRDVDANLDNPPSNLTLAPGQIEISFQTVDQLAEAMLYLAAVLQDQLDLFATRYEPSPKRTDDERHLEALLQKDVQVLTERLRKEDGRTV